MKDSVTREQWLIDITNILRPLFSEAGGEIPEQVRITCGWPSQGAKSEKKRTLGECWGSDNSDDEHFEIFISPTLDDGAEVAGVLVHELVHACVGIKAGHRAPFKKLATAVGLEGLMTATEVSDELAPTLDALVKSVGVYPHAKITFDNKKKQGTRMLKVVCPDPACGWSARTTQKWIDVGLPTCVCGTKMEVEEQKKPPEGGEEESED